MEYNQDMPLEDEYSDDDESNMGQLIDSQGMQDGQLSRCEFELEVDIDPISQ